MALAWAAKMANIPCTVVMPNDSSLYKRQALEANDVEVVLCEATHTAREGTCNAIAKDRNWPAISPASLPAVAANGTITLEFLEQVPQLQAIMIPVGGGTQLSGGCIAAQATRPDVRMFGVEPAGKELEKSLRAGKPMWTRKGYLMTDSLADGMRMQAVDSLTFPIIAKHAEKTVFSATNEDIIKGMRLVFQYLKIVIEPAAAAGVGSLLSSRFQEVFADTEHIGVVLEGGNVDMDRLAALLKDPTVNNNK
jgi:threonine dehydratase